MFSIEMGRTAKDKVTGFTGIIMGYCTYITGCNQVLLTPPVDEKGAHRDSHWFDEQRIEYIGTETLILDNNNNNDGFCEEAPIK